MIKNISGMPIHKGPHIVEGSLVHPQGKILLLFPMSFGGDNIHYFLGNMVLYIFVWIDLAASTDGPFVNDDVTSSDNATWYYDLNSQQENKLSCLSHLIFGHKTISLLFQQQEFVSILTFLLQHLGLCRWLPHSSDGNWLDNDVWFICIHLVWWSVIDLQA